MKKMIITMVILASAMVQGIAQEKLKVGDVVNGKLSITNETGLRAFLTNAIGNSGKLDRELKVEVSPTADRFFVYTKVLGNKSGIRSVGVLLVNSGNEAFIVAGKPDSQPSGPGIGGSATISCTGDPCTSCFPTVQWIGNNWLPIVVCTCEDESGICNMTVTFTINLGVGY